LKSALICAVLAGCGAFAQGPNDRQGQLVTPVATVAAVAEAKVQPPGRISDVSNASTAAPAGLPDAPSVMVTAAPAPPAAMIKLKPRPAEHRFFDATNSLALASLAAGLTLDAVSTQKGLSYPGFYEMNPLARPFVSSRAGAAAYSAGSFALLAGGMYMAHRKGHHKLERIVPFAVAGWETWLGARNYHVIANGTK
jgi:hypothetical protein